MCAGPSPTVRAKADKAVTKQHREAVAASVASEGGTPAEVSMQLEGDAEAFQVEASAERSAFMEAVTALSPFALDCSFSPSLILA